MKTLKHFNWTFKGMHGRVAVLIENEVITIAQIGGNAPPANKHFLLALITDDEWRAAAACHARRINPWCVERRIGMSGANDLRLRVLENEALGDAPIKNVMHFSMNEKMNQGYDGWLGDFYAILESWPDEWERIDFEAWVEDDSASIQEAPLFQPANGWNYPAIVGVRDAYTDSAMLAQLAGDDMITEIADEYPSDEIEIEPA